LNLKPYTVKSCLRMAAIGLIGFYISRLLGVPVLALKRVGKRCTPEDHKSPQPLHGRVLFAHLARRKAKGATPSKQSIAPFQETNDYSAVFPALFTLAHLALRARASDFFHAAVIFRFGFSAGEDEIAAVAVAFFFAHLFATPARMFASPFALSFRFGFRTISASPFSALSFAHLALAAAPIRARAAALIPLFFGCSGASVATGVGVSPPPKSAFSSTCSD